MINRIRSADVGKFKRWFIPLILSSMLLNSATADAADLIRPDSAVRFSGDQMGRAFEGRVGEFSAVAEFSPAGQLSGLRLQIQADSLDTQNAERDQLLHSNEWLEVMRFPEIRYEGESSDGILIRGMLTIRDTTLPLDLAVKTEASGEQVSVSAEGEIDRLAFGLGNGEWLDTAVVGASVRFNARLSFNLQGK